jgi:probable F420-dependent oxidoreductase
VRASLALAGLGLSQLLEAARLAESHGLHGVWLGDHLIMPVAAESVFPYGEGGRGLDPAMPFPDVWATLAHVAALTERIRLGTGVLLATLRHPFVVARAAATVQLLSNGRFTLGVGTGWLREEYEAVGVPFAGRGAALDEGVRICRGLWSGEPTGGDGPRYPFPPVQLSPAPAHPIGVYMGGSSERALRRAALTGDGWYGPQVDLEEAVRKRDRLVGLRGQGSGTFEIVVRPRDPSPAVVRSFVQEGFDHLVFAVPELLGAGNGSVRAVVEHVRALVDGSS